MSDTQPPPVGRPQRQTRILLEISESGERPSFSWTRLGLLIGLVGVALTLFGVVLTLLIHYGWI